MILTNVSRENGDRLVYPALKNGKKHGLELFVADLMSKNLPLDCVPQMIGFLYFEDRGQAVVAYVTDEKHTLIYKLFDNGEDFIRGECYGLVSAKNVDHVHNATIERTNLQGELKVDGKRYIVHGLISAECLDYMEDLGFTPATIKDYESHLVAMKTKNILSR